MFTAVPSRVSMPELDARILQYWKENDVFRRTESERPDAPLFMLYEGPPTANGSPGIHHVLARVFKDVICRYRTMKGYRCIRKGGWDTHGLPVELEIEKELGLSSKREIEEYGIEKFNAQCRESVFRYVKEWEVMTDRIGFWVDMEDPYVTLHNDFIETGWWILKQLWDKDLLYEGLRGTPHCPRCETSLSSHEVALGYQENTPDPSVFVKFRISEPVNGLPQVEGVPTFFLAWTTTPWTLPGNTALAVDADAEYAVVELDHDGQKQRLILASQLLESNMREEYASVAVLKGSDLVGTGYEPLYHPTEFGAEIRRFVRETGPGGTTSIDLVSTTDFSPKVVSGDFVSMDDGTGIVHIAPAFGDEDLGLGREKELAFVQPVNLQGNITGGYAFSGKFVKQADEEIMQDLDGRGLLHHRDIYRHTYPFCWRCDTPLLYYAKSSCLEELKEKVSSASQGIFDDLDLHRPFVDDVTLNCSQDGCSGQMRRIPEVMDAWFDSGAMPFAQWHYPFDNSNIGEDGRFPADYICEAVDQTRGWFYSLHALATLLKDALRWYLFTASHPGEPRRFSDKLVSETLRRVLLTLWNVYSFFTNYASIDNFHPDQVPQGWKPENELDRWILSELNVLVEQVDGYMDAYNPTDSGRRLQEFIDQLSNWYVRRSRRRFWKSENDTDKLSAYATLHRCLVTVSRLMAPLAPFMAEEIYQNLVCSADSSAPDSVHLDSYPVPDPALIDRELMEATRLAMQVSSMGRAARSRAGVKVRQPLAEVKVWGQAKYLAQVQSQILEELNIKQLTVIEDFEGEAQGYFDQVRAATEARNKGEFSGHGIHQIGNYWVSVEPGCLVAIDTKVSAELADEGLARELAHRIQGLRRNANFELTDRIATYYEGPEEIARVMGSHSDYISQETLSDQLVAGPLENPEGVESQKIEGMEVTLAVKRL
ncbi:Isoleucine--tRNA ligase [Geodia barretti]|uniref:isoleucine--tRNA ligase n=1 Tax=Geodia barretti TaxID=519541 RepID=A0AA35RKB6_GEOBA|nr:Isoleucine--tRNA ligase [Geodia barretti]